MEEVEATERFCAGCYQCPECGCSQACDFRGKSPGDLHDCLNCEAALFLSQWNLVREYDQARIDTFFPTDEQQRAKKRKAARDAIDVLVANAILDGTVTGDEMITWMRESIQDHG